MASYLFTLPQSAQSTPAPTWPVSTLVFAATLYPAFLCLLHTHVFRVMTSTVGFTEFCIYLGCLVVLMRPVRVEFFIVSSLIIAYLLVLTLLRGDIELKGFRDVMIPILFYSLGRHLGNMHYAEKIFKRLIWVVLAFAFFELFFLDWYSYLFNIFSYYYSQGINTMPTNFVSGSTLNVNGLRPEGIGRTILPGLLGSHRVSAIFLEPVSLGNFAVIASAWGLSKSPAQWRSGLFFFAAGLTLIALSDSRYGIGAVSMMLLLRFLPVRPLKFVLSLAPIICVAGLVLIALFYQGQYADNILGRLYASGRSLLDFNFSMVMGVEGAFSFFYDMGYPYVLTRLGFPLVACLWFAIWMMKMHDVQGERFRIYVALYITLLLCISGTSMFALKTAGLLWFLMGSSVARAQVASPAWAIWHHPRPKATDIAYAH